MNIVIVDSITGEEKHIKLSEEGSSQTVEQGFHVDDNGATSKVTEVAAEVEVCVVQRTMAYPHVCRVCGKGFAKQSFLNVHMRTHTGEKPYSCHICDASFSGQTALQRHIQRHGGIKAFKCQYCEKSYVLKNQCRDHEKLHTLKPEELKKCKCNFCGQAYRYPFQLRIHKRVHTGEKPVECDTCKKHFTSSKILYEHVRRVHKKEKAYKCSQCYRQFSDFSDSKRHMLTHTDEKPFKCDTCGFGFKRKYALSRHVNTRVCQPEKKSTEKRFCCKICNRTFVLELSLDLHMQIDHKDNDESVTQSGNEIAIPPEDTTDNSSQDAMESNETLQFAVVHELHTN